MLDVKRVRENFESVKADVERRGKGDFGIDNVLKFDTKRRELLAEVEQLKNKQNTVSREVPKLKKEGKDTSAPVSYTHLLHSSESARSTSAKKISLERLRAR